MLQKEPQTKKPSGMFGLKGTFRDILGGLGDALLISEGRAPLYRQQRQREKEGEAMAGFQTDPLGSIEKMASVNGQLAQRMMTAHQSSVNNAAKLRQAEAKAARQAGIDEVTLAGKKADNLKKARGVGGRMLQQAKPDGSNWASVRQLLNTVFEKRGIENPFDLPEEFPGAEGVSALIKSTINVEKNLADEDRDARNADLSRDSKERISIARQNAATSAANSASSIARRNLQNKHDIAKEGRAARRVVKGDRRTENATGKVEIYNGKRWVSARRKKSKK